MKKLLQIIGLIVVLLVCGLSIAVCSNMKAEDETPLNAPPELSHTQIAQTVLAEIMPPNEEPPTPEPVIEKIPAPPYATIKESVTSMTEIQWKEYLPTLKGMYAENWVGWVVDVDQSHGDEYKIWVDMDAPGTVLSVQDVYLYGISKEDAATVNKGAQITFSGTITNTVELLGHVSLHLENVIYQITN